MNSHATISQPLLLLVAAALTAARLTACAHPPTPPPPEPAADNLVLITIDTLRADRVGAYGYAPARTPTIDRLAGEGTRFDRAYAPAPITLTSHASLLSGLYPQGHGARHNGLRARPGLPTLATILRAHGFATGAFVAAFPLDRRFGLADGFDAYSDRMPRGADGRPANERPGGEVVREAVAWAARQPGQFFLWVHLFEPHAPYGDPSRDHRSPVVRYDEEVAAADAHVARLLQGLAPRLPGTLVVLAGDHGEAFGEHGEVGHSLFVYDTTLRVPLILSGAAAGPPRGVPDPVSLVDIAPTVLALLRLPAIESDGIDLRPALAGHPLPARALYAESFAPLFDFGWSPLRAVREGSWKAIAAPRPEVYDLQRDPGELNDLSAETGALQHAPARQALARLLPRLERAVPLDLAAGTAPADTEARARLAALGYLQGGGGGQGTRPDPKDRRAVAARISQATSGEVQGPALLALLEALAREDPGNGQIRMRLGYALAESGRVREAEPHFAAAVAAGVPSADPYLGLALCQGTRGAFGEALASLERADRVEPGNALVLANLGLLQVRVGRAEEAGARLSSALALDPDLHEARFHLALLHARAGRRQEAATQAAELLRRLPAAAPQRGEVERLLAAVR